MTTLIQVLTAIAMVCTIIIPILYYMHGEKTKTRYKKTIKANCLLFFGILVVAGVVTLAGAAPVAAAEEAATAGYSIGSGLAFLGAALAIGLSGIGSGIGVASSASAALGALSEDSSIFGKSLIFVAMAEGIALYGLIIAFMIVGKL